ncbi:MAG: hypothetical protein HY664_03620 [Chloroflexi bacterium]|nr:hypothetical protein [Chloroflexota bacterium]
MLLPEYVSKDEVKRVCKELGFRDWSTLEEGTISLEEASVLLRLVNTKRMNIPIEDFKRGLEVELEHGAAYEEANVTNNHPILTSKIVLAHLNETLDYYKRLEVIEIEGDSMKAVLAGNHEKIESEYRKLIGAQALLSNSVAKLLE